MKRVKLIRHLRTSGCVFVREGSAHSVYYNPLTGRTSTVPRHTEVENFLAKKICCDLGVSQDIQKN